MTTFKSLYLHSELSESLYSSLAFQFACADNGKI